MISRSADVRYDRTPTSTPTKVEVSTFDVVRGARSGDFGDAVSADDVERKFFATLRASRSSRVLRGEVGEESDESLSDEAVGLSPSDEPFVSFASCSNSDSDSEPLASSASAPRRSASVPGALNTLATIAYPDAADAP